MIEKGTKIETDDALKYKQQVFVFVFIILSEFI